MKKVKSLLLIISFIIIFVIDISVSQGQPPPPPTDGQRTSSQPTGGSDAPITGGIAILLALAGSYGGVKFYIKHKRSLLD